MKFNHFHDILVVICKCFFAMWKMIVENHELSIEIVDASLSIPFKYCIKCALNMTSINHRYVIFIYEIKIYRSDDSCKVRIYFNIELAIICHVPENWYLRLHKVLAATFSYGITL